MMTIRLLSRLRTAAILPLLAVLACTTSSSSDGPSQTKTIGAAGGTITLDNGVTVTVPAGAISADTQIGVKWLPDASSISTPTRPEGIDGAVAGAVVLTPHGTQFATPVQVTIPTTLTGDDFAFLRLADDNATAWTAEGSAKRVGATLQFSVLEFSTYSAVAVTAGACPCWKASDFDTFDAANRSTFQSFYPQYGVGLGIVQSTSGSAYLRLSGRVGPGGQTSGYACERVGGSAMPTTPITSAQASACYALLRARYVNRSRSTLNVGAYSTTLAAGQTAKVQLTITPAGGTASTSTVSLTPTDSLMWADGAFSTGATVTASVLSSPAGVTCTAVNSTATLGTENIAVLIDCQPTSTSTCPTAATGQTAPGALTKVLAKDVALSDDFSAATVDTDRWNAQNSDDEAYAVSGGAFVSSITARQNMGIGGVQIHAGDSSVSPLTGPLTASLKVTPPDLTQVTAAQMAVQVFGETNAQFALQINARGTGNGNDITFDGTYDVHLTSFNGQADSDTIELDPTTNKLDLTYDPQSGDLSATVTGKNGTQITLTQNVVITGGYNFSVELQALPNAMATLPLRSWSVDSIQTNQTIHYPEHWTMAVPGLSLGGTPYLFSGEAGEGALWFANLAQPQGDDNIVSISPAQPETVVFDGVATKIYARLCSLTVSSQAAKATFYSAIEDDAAFKTALDAQLVQFGASPLVIDAKATAFTRQNNGTYTWGLTCP